MKQFEHCKTEEDIDIIVENLLWLLRPDIFSKVARSPGEYGAMISHLEKEIEQINKVLETTSHTTLRQHVKDKLSISRELKQYIEDAEKRIEELKKDTVQSLTKQVHDRISDYAEGKCCGGLLYGLDEEYRSLKALISFVEDRRLKAKALGN